MKRERRRRPVPDVPPPLTRLVPETVAAPALGTTPHALRQARYSGRGVLGRLRYYKVGDRVRYDEADIAAARKACLVEPDKPERE
jgi:hypothetical protein